MTEAELAVRPNLPIPGVAVILGNWLVRAGVWAETPPPMVMASVPLVRTEPDKSEREFPETFSVCAVMRAMAAVKCRSDQMSVSKKIFVAIV